MAALLIALLLTMAVPVQAQPEAAAHRITLHVLDSSRPGTPLAGASVTFTDSRTGGSWTLLTNASGSVSFAPAGPTYFKILVNATGFYDHRPTELDGSSEFIRFDGSKDVELGAIGLVKIATTRYSVNLALSGTPPSDLSVRIAYVGVLDQTAYAATLTGGVAIQLPAGSYRISYRGQGLQPNAFTFTVSAARSVDVTLAASTGLTVNVNQGGTPAADASAYLISKQRAELNRMLIAPSQQGGGQFSFDAYPGDFYLVLASASGKAKVINVTLPATGLAVDLAAAGGDRTNTTFQISNGDWNQISLSTFKQLRGESSLPMMALSYLPDVRMQLDLDPTIGGNRNGLVDDNEVYNYTELLRRTGPYNVTSAGLFNVDGLNLVSDANLVQYDLASTGLIGSPVWSEADYTTTFTAKYTPLGGTVLNGKSSYLILLNPAYNTTYQGWSYRVRLPTDCVLLGSSVNKDPLTIKVSDYTVVSIESPSRRPGDRGTALVSLPVATAKQPSASVGVVITDSTYPVDQGTYIVRSGVAMTFNAAGSFDPNGNPLTYLWNFGDGGTLTTTSAQVTHTYWIPNLNVAMTVTVRDVSLRTATANLTLKIDSVPPTAVITVNGTTPSSMILVDQLQSVEYSAAQSYDLIYNEAVPQGIIRRYDWSFGDGFVAGDSVTARHAYLESGRFNLTCTITDASGRVTTSVFAVQVRDIVGPNVVVSIRRAADDSPVTGSASFGDMLVFDGSNSSDLGSIISYHWSMGDGTTFSGAVVQHAYTTLGTFTGRLTCIDAANNSAYRPFTLTILPLPGPDLRITAMSFDPPADWLEGSVGTVQISVVNVGSAAAHNISTGFYLVDAGGNLLLVSVKDVTVNGLTVDHLEIGRSGLVSASLSFPNKGSYTILANVTTEGDIHPGDNTRSASLQVQESAWKYAGIYFGLIFLVLVIAVLLYMRRGIGDKKGQRRKGKKR